MIDTSRRYGPHILIATVLSAWALSACVTESIKSTTPQSKTKKSGLETYHTIQSILNKGGETIGYDSLMQVHRMIIQSPRPISQIDQLLRQLIHKRNTNPRIDQMILIFTAKIIAGSRFRIPNVQELIETILNQDTRINEWVISFVAAAISDYAYNLPQGDRLVNIMEFKLAQVRPKNRSREEYFGFHFLPPPKSNFIRTYINGLGNRQIRQRERNLYYVMIQNGLTETEIESGMKFLQFHGAPDSGEKCPYLMICLIRHQHQLPFECLE